MALEVAGLRKHFAGVQAVRGVSFSVRPGECVALIGPNGAGKSTTFACIAGQHALTGGNVRWCGTDLAGLTPAQRLQSGIARTFQVAQVFDALTVWQNLALLFAQTPVLSPWHLLDQAHAAGTALDAGVNALLLQVGLSQLAGTVAGRLAYGNRKRLELAMALAGISDAKSPRLLLLDEPAAGLAASERKSLMAMVRALVDAGNSVETPSGQGLALLYTEHNMDAVFGVADRVMVLVEGELIAQGSASEIASNAQVQQRYLGSGWDPVAATGTATATVTSAETRTGAGHA